jgi:hypothetical protein
VLRTLARFNHEPENRNLTAKQVAAKARRKRLDGCDTWSEKQLKNARSKYPKA